MRRRLILLLLALAALGVPSTALADDPGCGTANCSVAINQTDNSSLFDFAFAIRHVMGDVVDQENAAVAISSCTSCQTTAIAIEIVLVEGDPSTVTPTNEAGAANVDCTLCDTFASAYQFVVGTGGPVRITPDGLHELHDIRKEIESWGKQGLSNDQIRALLPDVIARIKQVLATQLVPVGNGEQQSGEQSNTQTNQAQPNAPPGQTATTQGGQQTTTTTTPTGTDTTPSDTTTTQTTTTTPATATTAPATTGTTTTGTTTTTPTPTGP
jgi:hypothetical protein